MSYPTAFGPVTQFPVNQFGAYNPLGTAYSNGTNPIAQGAPGFATPIQNPILNTVLFGATNPGFAGVNPQNTQAFNPNFTPAFGYGLPQATPFGFSVLSQNTLNSTPWQAYAANTSTPWNATPWNTNTFQTPGFYAQNPYSPTAFTPTGTFAPNHLAWTNTPSPLNNFGWNTPFNTAPFNTALFNTTPFNYAAPTLGNPQSTPFNWSASAPFGFNTFGAPLSTPFNTTQPISPVANWFSPLTTPFAGLSPFTPNNYFPFAYYPQPGIPGAWYNPGATAPAATPAAEQGCCTGHRSAA